MAELRLISWQLFDLAVFFRTARRSLASPLGSELNAFFVVVPLFFKKSWSFSAECRREDLDGPNLPRIQLMQLVVIRWLVA